jgi:hypothetical protein
MRQIRAAVLGQLIGHRLPPVEKRCALRLIFLLLAEREAHKLKPKLLRVLIFQVR